MGVGDRLLIGTSKGQLLLYRITNDGGKLKVDLLDTKKSFAKKSIAQLAVIEQLGLLLSISDGFVCAHRLSTLEPLCRIEKSKGATLYSYQVQVR